MEKNICFYIKMISDKINARIDASLKELDITASQSKVLIVLYLSGELTQKEIENKLSVSHPTVVGIVNRLYEKGLVKWRIDETSNRKKIWLTDSAKQLQEEIFSRMTSYRAIIYKGISSDTQEKFIEILKTINENLSEETANVKIK